MMKDKRVLFLTTAQIRALNNYLDGKGYDDNSLREAREVIRTTLSSFAYRA